ncbi:MAG TPA: hypothetical protein VED59_08485, partial [Acidimicrobiales bacterium]|nr:hypothetical protein [Acidimicrobiales bacterium]
TTSFPAGFVDLRPPFYWFASQEEYRAYLPREGRQDWSVNGSVVTDCPTGVRPDLNSPPDPAKLFTTSG